MNDYQITTKRVDDVPFLLAQMEWRGIAAAIDAHIHPHGNHQGLSYGWLTVVWLTHLLSQADHRMNQVRDWVLTLITTLTACLPMPWRPLDFTDDRLADLLRNVSIGFETVFSTNYDHSGSFRPVVSWVFPSSIPEPSGVSRGRCGG